MEFSFTFSSVAARFYGKKGKKSASERPAKLCVKNTLPQHTHTHSQLMEDDWKKEKCSFSSLNGQKDVTGRQLKKEELGHF